MANFMVHLSDRASYFIEDAENEKEAILQASEWFDEREHQCSCFKLEPQTTFDTLHLDPAYNNISDELCRIFEKRATDPNRSEDARTAYNNALAMVLYMLNGDWNCLEQFDY